MGDWYLAPSLVRLRDTVDGLWPARDRRSDGAIGDTAHAARTSEHNPDAKGCVHALDIDVDGVDPAAIVRAVIAHPAAWYVIHNRRIWSRTHGWVARAYTGADPHTGHVHVSIELTTTAENNTTPWHIQVPEEDDMPTAAEIADAVYEKFRTTNVTGATGEADPQARDATLMELAIVATRHGYAAEQKLDRLTGAIAALAGQQPDIDEEAIAAALLPLLQRDDIDPAALSREIVAALPDTIAQQVLDGLAQRLATA